MFDENKQRIPAGSRSSQVRSRPGESIPTFNNSQSVDVRERVENINHDSFQNSYVNSNFRNSQANQPGSGIFTPNNRFQPLNKGSRNSNCHTNNYVSNESRFMVNTMPNHIPDIISHGSMKPDVFKTIDPSLVTSPNQVQHLHHNGQWQSFCMPQQPEPCIHQSSQRSLSYFQPQPLPGTCFQYIDQFGQLVQVFPNPLSHLHSCQQSNFQSMQFYPQAENVSANNTENLSHDPCHISHEFRIGGQRSNQTTIQMQDNQIIESNQPIHVHRHHQPLNKMPPQRITDPSQVSNTSIEAQSLEGSNNKQKNIISINSKKNSMFHSRNRTQSNINQRGSSIQSQPSVKQTQRTNITQASLNSSRLLSYKSSKNYTVLHQQRYKKSKARPIARKSTSPQSPNFQKRNPCDSRGCSREPIPHNAQIPLKRNQSKSPRYLVKFRNQGNVEVQRQQQIDTQPNQGSNISRTRMSNSFYDYPVKVMGSDETMQSFDQYNNLVNSNTPSQIHTNTQFVRPADLNYHDRQSSVKQYMQQTSTGQFGTQTAGSPVTQNFRQVLYSPPNEVATQKSRVSNQVATQDQSCVPNHALSLSSFEKGSVLLESNNMSPFEMDKLMQTQDCQSRQVSGQMQIQQKSTTMSDPKSHASKVVIKMEHLKDNLKQRQDSKLRHIPREQASSANHSSLGRPGSNIHSRKMSKDQSTIGMQEQWTNVKSSKWPSQLNHHDSSLAPTVFYDPLTGSMHQSMQDSKTRMSHSRSPSKISNKSNRSAKSRQSRQVQSLISPSAQTQLDILHQMQLEILNLKQTNMQLINQVNSLQSNQETQKLNILASIEQKDCNIMYLQDKINQMERQLAYERSMATQLLICEKSRMKQSKNHIMTEQSPTNYSRHDLQGGSQVFPNSNDNFKRQDPDSESGCCTITNEMHILDQNQFVDFTCQNDCEGLDQYCNDYQVVDTTHQFQPPLIMHQQRNTLSTLQQVDNPQNFNCTDNVQNQSIMSYSQTSNGTKRVISQGILQKSPNSKRVPKHVQIQTNETQNSSGQLQTKGMTLGAFVNSKSPASSHKGSRKNSSKKKRKDLKKYNNISNILPSRRRSLGKFKPSKILMSNYQQKTELNNDISGEKHQRSISAGARISNYSSKSNRTPVDLIMIRQKSQDSHIQRMRDARNQDSISAKSFADIVRKTQVTNSKSPNRPPKVSARALDDHRCMQLPTKSPHKSVFGSSNKKSFDMLSKLTEEKHGKVQSDNSAVSKNEPEDRQYQNVIKNSQREKMEANGVPKRNQAVNSLHKSANLTADCGEKQLMSSPSPPKKHSPIPARQVPHPSATMLWRETSPKPIVYKSLREQGSLSSKKPKLTITKPVPVDPQLKVRQLTPKSLVSNKSGPSEILNKTTYQQPMASIPEKKIKFNPLSLKRVNVHGSNNESMDSKRNPFQRGKMSEPTNDYKLDHSKSSFRGSFINCSKKSINESMQSSCQKNQFYKQIINGGDDARKKQAEVENAPSKFSANTQMEDVKVLQPRQLNTNEELTNQSQTRCATTEKLIMEDTLESSHLSVNHIEGNFHMAKHRQSLQQTNKEIDQININAMLKNKLKMQSILQKPPRSKSSDRKANLYLNENLSPHEERRKLYLQSWQNQVNERVQQKEQKRMSLLLNRKQSSNGGGFSRIR